MGVLLKNNDKIICKNGFDMSWKPAESKTTKDGDGFCSAREWQKDAFDLLKDSNRMILNAPMGSGKSWMMCLLSAYKMQQNNSLRCIIAVPQTIIASGFMSAKLLLPNEEKLIWSPLNNLCDEDAKFETTKYVIQWLEGAQVDLNDRTLICTHATLVAVYKQLIKKEKLSLFQNTLLWIDEAHHAKRVCFLIQ
jgi:superfamily II DNA or RNA helicase